MAGGILERIQKMFYKKEKRFSGNSENFMKNGRCLLEESISLFEGRTNLIRCLSVDELNTIDLDTDHVFHCTGWSYLYQGVWEGHTVLVDIHIPGRKSNICLDIVISAQMGIHNNVVQLLGCCLETEYPVLIFEGAEIKGSLEDRLLEMDSPLEWKDGLRIAWEISYALAYLHMAFPRPIIFRDITPRRVFLDQNNVAKLFDFSFSISIPKGQTHVEEEDGVIGTYGFIAPEYGATGRITEKLDVFCFGLVLLVLLRWKSALLRDFDLNPILLVEWARSSLEVERNIEMADPGRVMVAENSSTNGSFNLSHRGLLFRFWSSNPRCLAGGCGIRRIAGERSKCDDRLRLGYGYTACRQQHFFCGVLWPWG